jgi:hypothetical protein
MRYVFVSSDAKFNFGDHTAATMPANLLSALAAVDVSQADLDALPVKPREARVGAVHAYEVPEWMLSCDDALCAEYAEFITHVGRYLGPVSIH